MPALQRRAPLPVPIAPPAPSRSPERQRLAEAISALSEAVAAAERVEDARQKLDDRLFHHLHPAVETAKKAVEEAREAAPAMLVDRLLGEASTGEQTVEQAEAELSKAEAAVEEARQARRLLSEEAEGAEIAIGSARRDLDNAVTAVAQADRKPIIAEFFRTGRHLLRLSRVLSTLGVVSRGVEAVDLGLVLRIGEIAKPGSGGHGSLFTRDPDWAAALAALRDDPDAKLPGLPSPEIVDAGDAGDAGDRKPRPDGFVMPSHPAGTRRVPAAGARRQRTAQHAS